MSVLVDDLARTVGRWVGRGFERAAEDPEGAQRRRLDILLRHARDTAFGRDHGLSRVHSAEAYREAVPVRDYEGFRPYVDRMIAGESSILTPDKVFMYTTTSGTTSEPKLIPVNVRWQRELAYLVRLWLYRAMGDHKGLMRDGMVGLVSPSVEDHTPSGVPIGSVSGLTYQRVPWYIRQCYLLPYDVMTVEAYDLRYYLATLYSLARPASCAVVPNPSTLLRIAETGDRESESLIGAIRDGKLGLSTLEGLSQHDEQVCRRLASHLKPNPDRAQFLEQARATHGALRPRDVWPNMRFIGCWLGGSCGVQARRLKAWYGEEVPFRDIGFRATEATITVPISDGVPEGVLALEANFYEFIAEEEIEQENPRVLLAHELEPGRCYYILLTTRGGLYRYDINDIVEVRGFYRNAPLIAFMRKGRDMVNITGEKLHVNQIYGAAESAAEDTGLRWEQIQLIPDVACYRYDLLVEPQASGLSIDDLRRFLEAFDGHLKGTNIEYAHKRKSRRLHLPRLHEMARGWAARRQKEDVLERGKRDGQYKWPYVTNRWLAASRDEVVRTLDPPPEGASQSGLGGPSEL